MPRPCIPTSSCRLDSTAAPPERDSLWRASCISPRPALKSSPDHNRSSVYLYRDHHSENNGVARYQRNTKASTARSFAVQDLPRLALTGLMRTSEPNGVRVTEFSSI